MNIFNNHSINTVWPSSPAECWEKLRLDAKQVDQLKGFIEKSYADFGRSGRTFKHGEIKEGPVKGWLPRTVTFLESGEVIIKLKDVPLIGQGGERKVKKVYGAASGLFFARKRVVEEGCEKAILHHFHAHPQNGIVKTIDFHSKVGKSGLLKHYVVQQKYESDLLHLKGNWSFSARIHMALRLLEGLNALHKLPIDKNNPPATQFHGDLSLANILAISRGPEVDLDIDDFGQSGKLGVPDGKDWYFSPEIALLKKQLNDGKKFTPEELKTFNFKYRQKSDVWALGLVLASILRGQQPSQEVVGIKCISDIVKWPAGVLDLPLLTQQAIDGEIKAYQNALPKTAEAKVLFEMWKLVNGMLQINPEQRLTCGQARTIVHKASQVPIKTWNAITLPYKYEYGVDDKKYKSQKPGYFTEFPTEPATRNGKTKKEILWHPGREPKDIHNHLIDRSTSIFWKSDLIENISGLSFKGRLFKQQEGRGYPENEFAIFYHEKELYDGGFEYGWVFREDSNEGIFYLLSDANLNHQKWDQWPHGTLMKIGPDSIQSSFQNLEQSHYWNIQILDNGDFKLEITNPETWESKSCLIKKPDHFPNLKGAKGYITITAQKRANNEEVKPPRAIHVEEVKVWQ